MATMKEVANRAGVSVATVSRVVNQTGYVRAALKTRVHDAMRDLRYHPSALARSLRRQETLSVGLLLPHLDQPFFSRVAMTIVHTLFEQNYRTLVCSSEGDPTQEAAYIDMLIRQRVDGVIVVPTGLSQGLRVLIEQGLPIVLLDRDVPTLHVNKVFCNHRQGGYLAARHLLDLGHKRIAIVGGDEVTSSVTGRIEGASEALKEKGLSAQIHLEHVESDADSYSQGYEITKNVLKSARGRPTAIFALTDVVAVGAMRAARDRGLSVPDDLSVIGFDDIPLARQCIPALTTIAQPTDEMGHRAAEILLASLGNRDVPVTETVLETRLIVRESTRRA